MTGGHEVYHFSQHKRTYMRASTLEGPFLSERSSCISICAADGRSISQAVPNTIASHSAFLTSSLNTLFFLCILGRHDPSPADSSAGCQGLCHAALHNTVGTYQMILPSWINEQLHHRFGDCRGKLS